ncbi:GRP family sugar transporter [Mucilaginibacter gotjawali]|uniref:Fatty acid elongase 3-ketoacyl-CoA synthase 1 n=2 Tax=Mucilaginibacter gotjawali TaxID=1550579 RepID=A0A110AZW4_9SPHI|nr:GRP family sugar transporter [Mucilaginibacter gotjawali]MBB3058032.1 glucose uptake protein [Mucilaginibacter gotjawali]BAU52007.1 Fatty acid elongase 3-ketoacyl-CoA synthase 1 [Mucilaginibacter gotjawali]
MFIVSSYAAAIVFCIITMLCWGSWANSQKLAAKSWRFELFYWDYVIGILFFSVLSAFTLGSFGTQGRSFLADLKQADGGNIASALIGGIVFNAANILFSAAIAIAGMAVAFPVAIGIALVLGVLLNYFALQQGNPVYLFAGVGCICLAIILNAMAFRKAGSGGNKVSSKGIVLSIVAGVLMSFFYRFIAASMDLQNFAAPAAGKMTPYTAVFIFSVGILLSNFLFNTILMKKPFSGLPVSYADYFKGNFKTHLTGVLGGAIWGIGNSFNLIAAGKAGPAISYGLGQGATLIAALWGILIWKEFKNAPKGTNALLSSMLVAYVIGLGLIIGAK